MSNSIVAQVSKNLLFRYRIACKAFDGKFNTKFKLDDSYQLPHFGQFEKQHPFGNVRVGWNDTGLFFDIEVSGKQQSVWCRENELLESDGIQLWIDTRDTHNIHRASKFCHWFVWLPSGGDSKNPAVSSMLKINRSQEDSPAINRFPVQISSNKKPDGYQIKAFLPGKALHGWNTQDHLKIGFNYLLVDRELGRQSLAIGPELPIREDPSLWQTLTLET